jgi:uncharacterized membrane protein (Fun14 family)
MRGEKMSMFIQNLRKKIAPTYCRWWLGLTIILFSISCQVNAANEIVAKVNNIYTIVINIITTIGAIVLAWGIFELASAYQSHDSSLQTQALKKVVSGILMCTTSALVGLLQ